jgi:hypothetical protein
MADKISSLALSVAAEIYCEPILSDLIFGLNTVNPSVTLPKSGKL